MLYIKVLERLVQERDIQRSQYAQVLRSCEGTIKELKEEQQVSTIPNPPLLDTVNNNTSNHECDQDGKENEDEAGKLIRASSMASVSNNNSNLDTERFFVPLEMAATGDCPRVTTCALDGIQKLLAHGVIIGNYPNPANPNKRMIDRMVETICSCFKGQETDEKVELQIIKALLTIVTSQHVQIHEGTVLLTLRTCFNIYVASKSLINQSTTKAMLTQMLHSIFSRMESVLENMQSENVEYENEGNKMDSVTEHLANWKQENASWFGTLDFSGFFRTNSSKSLQFQCASDKDIGEDQLNKGDKTSGNPFLEDKNRASPGNPFLEENEEGENNTLKPEELNKSEKLDSTNLLQKDAFLAFWAICKLAVKSSTDPDSPDSEANKVADTKGKTLSLELLRSVVQNCGSVFHTNQMFVAAVKQHLCSTIRETGVPSTLDAYRLVLELFGLVFEKFYLQMPEELKTIFEEIIITTLEEEDNNSIQYKQLALNSVKRIFISFVPLAELVSILNQEGSATVERLIISICKLSYLDKLGTQPTSLLPMKMLALDCLITLLQKMEHFITRNNQETITSGGLLKIDESQKSPIQSLVSAIFMFLECIPESLERDQVDVLVQEFARKLYENRVLKENTESADALYSLVYSTIHLIAELTQEGNRKPNNTWYIRCNQAISTWHQALPDECLNLIYEEIDGFLKQQRKRHKSASSLKSQSQPLTLAHNAKRIISLTALQQSPTSHDKLCRCVKKMFKVVGKHILNALAGILMACDDTSVTDLCLSGIRMGIHVSGGLNLKHDREAFVQALSRLSTNAIQEIKDRTANTLVVTSQIQSTTTTENGITKTTITTTRETKCRNVDIILALLNITISEGNHLDSTWLHFLKCISKLDAANLLDKVAGGGRRKSEAEDGKSWYAWANSLVPSFWESSAGKLDIGNVKRSMDGCVSRMFQNSVNLSGQALVEFFRAMCQVSLIEITHPEDPRSFVYENIFEVAHMNLYRPCYQWCEIWKVLSDYFSHLACSSDEDVSFFAIDSLTKLVVHLLEKETSGDYRFQAHFLKPYETITHNAQFTSTREYVLAAVTQIVMSHSSYLLSGWIPIFNVLHFSIFQDEVNTATVSFALLKQIIDLFENGNVKLSCSYPILLNCLVELAFKGPNKNVQADSLKMFKQIGHLIQTKPEVFVSNANGTPDILWEHGWLPVFQELSEVILNNKQLDYTDADQANALSLFFEVIKDCGDGIAASCWKSLFAIMFRIFNRLKPHGGSKEQITTEAEQMSPSQGYSQFYCYYYVQFAVVDVFVRYYDVLGETILEDLLAQLQWCIQHDDERVSLAGIQCLHQIVRMLQNKISRKEWNLVVPMIAKLLTQMDEQDDPCSNPVSELELWKVLQTIVMPKIADADDISLHDETNDQDIKNSDYKMESELMLRTQETLGHDNLFLILSTMDSSSAFFSEAYCNLRSDENKETSTKDKKSALILSTYICLLTTMYFDHSWSNDEVRDIEDRFMRGIERAIVAYALVPTTKSLSESMAVCIRRLHKDLDSLKFDQLSSALYPKICDLIEADFDNSLSEALAKYLVTVIRTKLGDCETKP